MSILVFSASSLLAFLTKAFASPIVSLFPDSKVEIRDFPTISRSLSLSLLLTASTYFFTRSFFKAISPIAL